MSWWRIAKCTWQEEDTRALDAYLADAWEPFAVTEGTDGLATIWLRRSSEREHAEVAQPGPRLESEAARLIDGINRDMERLDE